MKRFVGLGTGLHLSIKDFLFFHKKKSSLEQWLKVKHIYLLVYWDKHSDFCRKSVPVWDLELNEKRITHLLEKTF